VHAAAIAAFDRTRKLSRQGIRSLCYAPFANLYFDRFGRALVCCWNRQLPVGNVRTDSMDEIWRGPVITELRETLARYEFARGCDFCDLQTADGVFGGVAMAKFDRFPVSGAAPDWPAQIEFSISNACNLECVMCDGNHSSAIRARREDRAPMPRLYSGAFLESLRPYLAHLDHAKFLGGEPFLVTEHFRLWDMMIEDGLATRCHVTTNGTQYGDRVERYLDRLGFGFCVSLDAATKETYESIRINASFEEVMRNSRRFRDYAHKRKTAFSFGFCLMRQNWREFGQFCLMADEWDAVVALSTVHMPAEMAIYTLPAEDLRMVLHSLERQADELDRRLKRNKSVWFAEVERIRARVRAATSSSPRKYPLGWRQPLWAFGKDRLETATN
jgi:MoaA/NifB/PqqE/SkfB family radical SAM enzyme